MSEILWIFKCGIAVWVAWRVVIMMDALNPLMAMGFATAFMIGGPLGFEYATEWISNQGDPLGVCELMGTFQMGSQVAFAFIGVLFSLLMERVSAPVR